MDSRKILSAIALMSLAATVACGTGGGSIILPNPSGNFSNASLKGSYVYEIHGIFLGTQNFQPYRQVGVFTADGNGNITGGTDDSSLSVGGTAVTGTYTIAKDGSGQIVLNTSVGTINLAATIVSTCTQANPLPCSPNVYLMEADAGVGAAGTAELQDSTATNSAPSGSFVFKLHQEVSAENGGPSSEVGGVSLSGGSGSGSMDQNLTGTFSSPNLSWTVSAPTSLGRGTGSFINSSTNFTTDFVYYVVSDSKAVLLVSNLGAVGSGTAELQSGNVAGGLSGSYAFGSRGEDSQFNFGIYGGIQTVGVLTAASGSITGNEDINQEGNVASNESMSSCYTAASSGRVAVNTTSGNTCTGTLAQVFWMVSPSRAFFLNVSTSSAEDGTADLQASGSFANSSFNGQFGVVMDGMDVNPETLCRIGLLQFDGSGKLTLNEVVNSTFSGANTQLLGGNYTVSPNGRIVGNINNGGLDLVMYAVSPSRAYVLQTDAGAFTSGALQLQQ